MSLSLIRWAHSTVFTPPQRGEHEIQPCGCRNAVSTGLCLHEGPLAEMSHPWRNRRVSMRRLADAHGSVFRPLFSSPLYCSPAFMPRHLSVCERLVVVQMGKQDSLNGTHAQLQYVGNLRQKTVAFVPSNSLISWARCWCCCLSAPLAEAAVISAYLNCELITSSQFSLSSVHYCLNPHEDPSILGTAVAQEHVLHLTTYRSTHLYTPLTIGVEVDKITETHTVPKIQNSIV